MEELDLVSDLNKILSKHGIQQKISLQDLTITDNTVSDMVKSDKLLSDTITDFVWKNLAEKEVFHYTNKAKAESILKSNKFRLYTLTKRFSEGEISTFCNAHNLKGYLEKDKNTNEPVYKSLLMNNMYYASFSDTYLNEMESKYLKEEFSSFQGVRLKLRITAKNKYFKNIVYDKSKGAPIEVIKEITDLIESKYNRKFILHGISKLCAFYLSNDFKLENEFRILLQHNSYQNIDVLSDGQHKYVELPLGTMSQIGYMVEVLGIQTNENLSIPDEYKPLLKRWV
ncbi:hypothetical protein ACED34_25185 [Vibrio splendidus]|uniref:hypothetical protein n=1 Tax=Vibrio splendidus TaxID=29497 RepID=UPI00352EF38B